MLFKINTTKIISHLKYQIKNVCCSINNTQQLKPPWRIMFFGNDNFSLKSLELLYTEFHNGDLLQNLEVVTTLKKNRNPVHQYALLKNLPLHNWPLDTKLCKSFDIGIVVSFGNLIPESVINAFPLGMINVHASLLPRWRGAAPIIFALAAGDTKTGVSIMRIKPNKFDVGEILSQKVVDIPMDMTMPDLYTHLSKIGAVALLENIQNLPQSILKAKPQPTAGVTYAPRINQSIGIIDWSSMTSEKIYNLSRALHSLYPLQTTWLNHSIKLFNCSLVKNVNETVNMQSVPKIPGYFYYNRSLNEIHIQCIDNKWISVKILSISGKKQMSAKDFYNGYLSKHHPKLHQFR